jgi:hypothetical protein
MQKFSTTTTKQSIISLAKKSIILLALWYRFGIHNVNHNAIIRLAIYPNVGIAFNRVKKNANTSTVIFLRELESGSDEGRRVAKRKSVYRKLPVSELIRLSRMRFLVITRNPYTRLLSAFLDKFRPGRDDYRKRYLDVDCDPEGFRKFVFWLKNGGLERDKHWDLQTKLMVLPLGLYDVVIKLEKFRIDMLKFFETEQKTIPADKLNFLHPSDSDKKTDAESLLHVFYTCDIKDIVYDLYKKDFDELLYCGDFPVKLENWQSGHSKAQN